MSASRRRFLARASSTLAAAAAASLVAAPSIIAQPKIQWRMSTTWTTGLDQLQGAAQRLAKIVEETSGGRFRIDVFPGGQIMQPFECFDATSRGTVEAYMASAYYWTAKEPAETYAPFNLTPRPATPVPTQMAGWFRKKITTIADYKGLRMRIGTGLGGKVVARAGGTAVLIPAAEIYAALERGVIDAAEWIAPYDDMVLGLQNTARYYYYPGWQEPGNTTEFGFNRKAYESLPVDLKRTLDHAAAAVEVYGLADFNVKNAVALGRLRAETKGKVEILQLPVPVVTAESEKTPMAKKVHASFTKFQALVGPWDQIAEGAYHRLLAT